MPPPTASDPWLAGRRFGVVIDAGSSGSRLQIYSWRDPRVSHRDKTLHRSLPQVEKGSQTEHDWSRKVEPGISTFADDPEGVAQYLVPLLEHARSKVPPSLQPETPLFLLATAGMRLLTPVQQGEILLHTCRFLRHHSNFRIDERSHLGPCGSSVRIITGEEEGLFGWIAVNYLMDGFAGSSDVRTTYGFLDMGGASTQIAFEPSEADRNVTPNLINVRLRRIGGEEVQHQVFVTTWLGYGTNQARQRYVGKLVSDFEHARVDSSPESPKFVQDPCFPKNLEVVESVVHSPGHHSGNPHTLVGTGSFEECLERTSALLNKDAPCPDSPCLFNGVQVPPIDFSVSHFIGVSEYWYSTEHVFGLGGPYDFLQYERAASHFCSRNWADLLGEHEQSRQHDRLGGDGEVEEGGRVVKTGGWGYPMELSRLRMQCFKAAWITNVLHEGIGLPRIVDPGGNSSTDGNAVEEQAARKGLGRPAFQSLDSVGDIAISWTLGKMVLEASKEVPLTSSSDRPLHDPLDEIPDYVDSPIRRIRPPFIDLEAIEDRISYHLPSLSKSSLGFSPLIIFYAIILCVVLVIGCRVRRYLRIAYRKVIRGLMRHDGLTQRDYSMEEGKSFNGAFSYFLSSPRRWLYALHRYLLSPSHARLTQPNAFLRSPYGNGHYARKVPSRAHSSSSLDPDEGVAAHSTTTNTRPSSPSPVSIRPTAGGEDVLSRGVAAPMRSRNSSHMNLSTLVPRQPNALSRSNSMLHAAADSSLRDE